MNEIIVINNLSDFKAQIKRMKIKELGHGSEGTVYKIKENRIIKDLSEGYKDFNYSAEEYLRFNKYGCKHFYFAQIVYTYYTKVIAAIYKECPGKTLSHINPLNIKLSKFISAYQKVEKEIVFLSQKGIRTYDAPKNCMYIDGNMGIVDTAGYYYSDCSTDILLRNNLSEIQNECLDFLIDGYFNYYIKNNRQLNEKYINIKNNVTNIYVEFLTELKKSISEDCEKNIDTLINAKMLIKKTQRNYQ